MVIFYNRHNKTEAIDNELLNYVTRVYFRFFLYVLPIFGVILALLHYYYTLNLAEIAFLVASTSLPAFYRFFTTYYQALGKWAKYNLLNVLYNLLKGLVLLFGGGMLIMVLNFEASYNLYLLLFILYAFVLLFVGVVASYKLIGTKYTRDFESLGFYKIVWPLGLSNVIIAFAMRADNILIEYTLGLKAVAVYSAANSLALVFPLVTGSIMRVFMKEVSKNSDYYLGKILDFQKRYFFPLILFVVLTVYLSPFIIDILYGGKYDASVQVFQILIIAYIGGIFFTPIESYFYNEDSKLILYVKAIQLVTFILFSIILMKFFSLYGIAFAVLITRIGAWFYFSYLARKRWYATKNQE